MDRQFHDDLDHLLAPPVSAADPLLRERMRERTTRSLRRQRQLRRLGIAAALAACYAAGLLTVWLLRSAPDVAPPGQQARVDQPRESGPPSVGEQTPQQLEMLAEQADGVESARLYVAAGRKFGRDFAAWDAALRCYRNALDADPDLVNSIDPEHDDWLLVNLKKARMKERVYASDLD